MDFKISFIIVFTFSLLAGSISYGQAEIKIISQDSTKFLLKVNTELITDSLNFEVELQSSKSKKINLNFLDSLSNPILEQDAEFQMGKTKTYFLSFFENGYRLTLKAEESLIENNVQTTEISREISDLEIALETPIIIETSYKSAKFPNADSISQIEDMIFQREKIQAISEIIDSKDLTKTELLKVLNMITLEDKRLEIIIFHSTKVKNILSKPDVLSLFKLQKYQDQVLESLEL